MDIAHGQIKVDLNDADVVAGLRRIDSEFDRTMSRIDREKAVAEIEADIAPLADKVEKAKRKLRELKGEKATVRADANTGELTRKIKNAERELARLDGKKATLEIKLKGAEKALATEAALEEADRKRAKAGEDASRRIEASLARENAARERAARENLARVDRNARVSRSLADQQAREEANNLRQVNERARVSSSLERQRVSELRTSEAAAHRMDAAFNKAQYDRDVGSHRELTRILSLQKQYARLTDQLERLDRKKPIGREARAKVELDATGVVAKMEALKAELNFLGAHPPVDIKADVNEKGLKRATRAFGNFFTGLANKASGLQDLSVRLGPFTTSLRGLGLALGFLGPTITDLLGAAGSLVGVLGAGISGAAALGSAAVVGLGGDFLGLKFATRNTAQELTQARTSINAYQTAVLKYGKGSDKAVAKQKEMNSVLRQISPLAREAAKGTERFFTGWDKATKPTQNNLGLIAKQGFAALNRLRPMWAQQTNEMSGMLQKGLAGAFKFLGQGQGKSLLSNIFGNFNAEIPTLLHGLGSLGHAFLNFASAGSNNFSVLAHGFDNLATRILNFTQSDNFGATVHRWVQYASDLMHFFGAAGRVMVHFFGDGSAAGDRFTNTMTRALNRWDAFLTSAGGKNKVGQFFSNSVKGAQELWKAFAPIVRLFALWSVGLEPAVTVITGIAAAITNAAAALGKFVGLGNPLKTMGATFGALFAVSKIGSFVSLLARAAGLLNDMRKAEVGGGIFGVLRNIGNGSFLTQLRGGQGIASAATAAAAEWRSAIIGAGSVVAGEWRAAIAEGGAAAGAEEALGAGGGGGVVNAAKKIILPGAAAAAGGEAAAAAAPEIAAGGAAIGGIGVAAGAATAGIGLLLGGLVYLAIKSHGAKTEVDKVNDSLKENATSLHQDTLFTRSSAQAQDQAVSSRRSGVTATKQLHKELGNLTKGTVAYRQKQLELFDAEQKAKRGRDDAVSAARQQHDSTQREIDDEKKRIQLIKDRQRAAQRDNNTGGVDLGGGANFGATRAPDTKAQAEETAALSAEQRKLQAAYNARAAAAINVGRAEKGMAALSGRAAQQMGALARQGAKGQSLAQTISLKYENPTNAGNVAASAKAALGAGIKIKTIMQVIADSSSAEAALRRLRAITLTKKMQQVGITGHDGVLSTLDKIDRKAIRQKIAHIIAQGGNPTIEQINHIIQMQIRDKSFSVQAAVSQAIAEIDLVNSGLSRLQSKSIIVSVHHLDTYGSGPGHHASGQSLNGPSQMSLIGEGGAPEYHINTKRRSIYKTPGPMLTQLGPNDAIIPTEPKYRQNARSIMADVASSLGMSMFAKGKKLHHHPKVDKAEYLRLDPSVIDTNAGNADQKLSTDRQKAKETSGSGKHKKKTRAARAAEGRLANDRIDAMYWDKMRKRADAFSVRLQRIQENADAAATRMNSANDRGDEKAWANQQGIRKGWLDKARKALKDEASAAPKGTKWAADIDAALAQVSGDIQTNNKAKMADSETAATTFTKDEQSTLDMLNAALAVDALTDDANVDDIRDTTSMISFLGNILTGMQTNPASLAARGGFPAITEVAGMLKTAQDNLKGYTTVDNSADTQAQLDQANQRASIAAAGQGIAESALSAFTGSGDIGMGGSSAYQAVLSDAGASSARAQGSASAPSSPAASAWATRSGAPVQGAAGSQTVINISTLHPGDPATLRAVGDAATAGMGYQGFRDTPRESVGY